MEEEGGIKLSALKSESPNMGVSMTGVAVDIKVDQLRAKLPGVCDACSLMLRRQGGEWGNRRVIVCSFEF